MLSPIWLATVLGHGQAAECLIHSGADLKERLDTSLPDAIGNYNLQSTLLHVAVRQKNIHLAELLLLNGADPGARDSRNVTPLFEAIDSGCPLDLIQRMIDFGGRRVLAAVDTNKRTYLHPAINASNEGLAELLLSYPEVNSKLLSSTGRTTLHLTAAAPSESVKIAEMLLNHGLDVNAVDLIFGDTALQIALRSSKFQMVR